MFQESPKIKLPPRRGQRAYKTSTKGGAGATGEKKGDGEEKPPDPWPNRKGPDRPSYAYRCCYCVASVYNEPNDLKRHIFAKHHEIWLSEIGSSEEDKWTAAMNRVDNLNRKSYRGVAKHRCHQHFEELRDILKSEDRPELVKMLDLAICYMAAELSCELVDDETYLPHKLVCSLRPILERLQRSPAYSDSTLYWPTRQP